jgi:hypothetical protein
MTVCAAPGAAAEPGGPVAQRTGRAGHDPDRTAVLLHHPQSLVPEGSRGGGVAAEARHPQLDEGSVGVLLR